MSERSFPLSTSLGEASVDVLDVLELTEGELEDLGSDAKHLIKQLEDLAFELAMLAEDKYHNTRYCDNG